MKFFFKYIVFLTAAIAVHGQVNLAVIPDARDLRADQQLTLTIILEIQGDEFAQQSHLQLMDTSKFTLVGSRSKQNTDVNAETKKVLNQIVYQIVLQPKKEGRIKIGSALVTVNNHIYKTEPFDVFVTKAEVKPLAKVEDDNDMFLNLEVKDKNIYKNQPTIAVLKVYSKNFDNFRKLSQIKVPQNSNVNFRQINFKKSDIEKNAANDLASQVVAVFLISPRESGNISIPPVRATVKNTTLSSTLKSNRVNLNVKKLPKNEPSNYKNAVGDFSVKLSSDAGENHLIGDPVKVKIKISGEGNFKTMILPRLEHSAEYTFFAPKIIYKTKNSNRGFTGDVELQYVVIPKQSGKILLKTEAFSFFNPAEDNFTDLQSDTLSFKSFTQEELSASKSTLDKMQTYTSNVLKTVREPKILSERMKNSKTNTINYKLIAANLALVFGLAFFFFRYRIKKKKKHQKKELNQKTTIVENVSDAENRLKMEETLDFEVEILYLEKLKNENKHQEFYDNYEILLQELERYAQKKYNLSFSNLLQKENGAKEADDFITLREEFGVEKFSPFQSDEKINSLFFELKKILSEIKL